MARTRQKSKQRKAKRLEQERKLAERSQQPDGANDAPEAAQEQEAATERALAEVEEAQLEAATELFESQRVEPGAAGEAARSAAAFEAATAAEAITTGKPDPAAEAELTEVKPSRRARRRAEAAREETRTPEPRRREKSARERAQPKKAERKEPRQRGRVVNFLAQVWAELRRVQWPTRNQVTQATAVVIVFCVIAGLYLGAWDFVFNKLIKLIL